MLSRIPSSTAWWLLGGWAVIGCSTGLSGEGPETDASTVDASADVGAHADALEASSADAQEEASGDATLGDGFDGTAMADAQGDGEATEGAAGDGGDSAADAGLDSALDAPSDDSSADGSDAAPSTCDETTCGGACCDGRCVPRTCAGCASGTILCPYAGGIAASNGYCVADCAACAPGGAPGPFVCTSCTGAAHAAECHASASECPTTPMTGACACDDATPCPGDKHVCAGGVCLTCGQPNSDGVACSGGGTCNASTGICE